jgi:hypothetical protein
MRNLVIPDRQISRFLADWSINYQSPFLAQKAALAQACARLQ